MATFTPEGLVPTTLAGFIEALSTAYRGGFGNDLDFGPETPQGQTIGLLALQFAEWEEALIAVGNGLNLYRALGIQLEDLLSLLGVQRALAAQSTVTVTLTGTPSTLVAAGSRARTTAGAVFALTAATAIETSGTVTATMQAVESGPVEAAAGTLTGIVDIIAGWTAVTNPNAASLGRARETDVAYRSRGQQQVMRNARSSADAILAVVREAEGVTDAIIRVNNTDASMTVQTVDIDARSFLVIVEGGTDAAVAAAIERSKPLGVSMTGAVAVDVPHASGAFQTPIKFSRVALVPLTVTIDTTFGPGFPGGGSEDIVQRVVAWAAGTWQSGAGDFDTTGLGIGETLNVNQMLAPILSVPGHVVGTITAVRKAGGAAIDPVALNERLTVAATDVSIS